MRSKAGPINKIGYEIDAAGACFVATSLNLSAGCLTDLEVDESLAALKEDLDAVAKKMKRAIHNQRKPSTHAT